MPSGLAGEDEAGADRISGGGLCRWRVDAAGAAHDRSEADTAAWIGETFDDPHTRERLESILAAA